MTIHSSSLILLCLCLLRAVVVTAAGTLDFVSDDPFQCCEQNVTNLHLYLHQFPAWPNVTNPNEAILTGGNPPSGFGAVVVHDWILTAGLNPNEKIIARAQGFHLQAGQTSTSWYTSHIFAFQDGSSTLEVLGLIVLPAGEWAIMGGTGSFAGAHGTIKYNTVPSTISSITDVIRELDIQVLLPLTKVNDG